jgi:hypothetical protein
MPMLTRVLCAAAICGLSISAQAAVIQPPGAMLPPGSLPLSGEITASSSTGSGVNPTLALPGSYQYGNTFTAPTAPLNAPYSSWGFYDSFVFTVGGSTASSVTTTINFGSMLGISNLQERLYSANPGDPVPVLGAPPALGGPGYFLAWTTPLGSSGEVAVLQSAPLAPGTYVLEIRGLVFGTAGGSYAGVLNVTPVPLPAGLPMLITGLGLVGGLIRRRVRGEQNRTGRAA